MVKVRATSFLTAGGREGKPVDETRYYVTSLRTAARALLQHIRDRWSIENSWYWP